MKYLGDALSLANSRGYLASPEVVRRTQNIPIWFKQLGRPHGILSLSRRLGVPVPTALQEFYSTPALAAFLELTSDETLFEQFARIDLGLRPRQQTVDHLPIRIYWDDFSYIGIQHNAHGGYTLGARIDQDDPFLADGEHLNLPDDPNAWQRRDDTLSEWLFDRIDNYERKLETWEEAFRRAENDDSEFQRMYSSLTYAIALPGMKERLSDAQKQLLKLKPWWRFW